jgi:hypothetical protein
MAGRVILNHETGVQFSYRVRDEYSLAPVVRRTSLHSSVPDSDCGSDDSGVQLPKE